MHWNLENGQHELMAAPVEWPGLPMHLDAMPRRGLCAIVRHLFGGCASELAAGNAPSVGGFRELIEMRMGMRCAPEN